MKRFADTFYFLALLNPKDRAHQAAMAQNFGSKGIVTTEWVLAELADALAMRTKRQAFGNIYQILQTNTEVEIVPSGRDIFARGVQLFTSRFDKDWSLTDCISFIVMQDRGLTDALTGDRHFEQAGFRALLTER